MTNTSTPDVSTTPVVPLHTLTHMVTIKLTSSNYLLWRNQILLILASHELSSFVDGSSTAPSPSIPAADGSSAINPAFTAWSALFQKMKSVILSTLTEEAMSEVLGCDTARSVWVSLEATFGHSSPLRVYQL
ncbi:hypothetical protein ACS0TY_016920 [Phlomoides rotata]